MSLIPNLSHYVHTCSDGFIHIRRYVDIPCLLIGSNNISRLLIGSNNISRLLIGSNNISRLLIGSNNISRLLIGSNNISRLLIGSNNISRLLVRQHGHHLGTDCAQIVRHQQRRREHAPEKSPACEAYV